MIQYDCVPKAAGGAHRLLLHKTKKKPKNKFFLKLKIEIFQVIKNTINYRNK